MLSFSSGADLEQSIQRAVDLFSDRRRWLPAETRIQVLREAAVRLAASAETWAYAVARESGKPLIDSRVEVARAADGLNSAAETLRTQAGRMVPMGLNAASSGRLAFTTHEPIGPVLAISAFNHPLNNVIHQVVPALASGCPVRVKPAPATPLVCQRLVALLREAGLPEGWCKLLLPQTTEQIQKLASDSRFAFVSFIGSAEVGWQLRGRIAPGVRLSLELGGAAPVVVDADANLEDVVPRLTKGGFYHAGQVCVSVQRIFALGSIARPLAEKLARAASLLRVGDPTHEDTQVGPLIRTSSVERVGAWVEEARGGGAEVLVGGGRLSDSCYAPTVLWKPPRDARVSREEVFGPVVGVYPSASLEEAITRANAVPYAFQAAVFTQSLDRALLAQRCLRAAAVMVNDHTAFRVDWMPFGGHGVSGLGVGGIPFAMREMQAEKLCVIRSEGLVAR